MDLHPMQGVHADDTKEVHKRIHTLLAEKRLLLDWIATHKKDMFYANPATLYLQSHDIYGVYFFDDSYTLTMPVYPWTTDEYAYPQALSWIPSFIELLRETYYALEKNPASGEDILALFTATSKPAFRVLPFSVRVQSIPQQAPSQLPIRRNPVSSVHLDPHAFLRHSFDQETLERNLVDDLADPLLLLTYLDAHTADYFSDNPVNCLLADRGFTGVVIDQRGYRVRYEQMPVARSFPLPIGLSWLREWYLYLQERYPDIENHPVKGEGIRDLVEGK